jgi:cephalosporin-C deacetylase-like acetyl esterase
VTLGGWLYLPDGPGPHPAITMAHAYAGVKEHGLERFARAFADDGFVVLVHDHRGFGSSVASRGRTSNHGGRSPTGDARSRSSRNRPEVDPGRIGLWGTSYAGGHAIVLGATDRRLRAVVAQVPTIRGFEHEPGVWVGRVSPTPLLMVVALDRHDHRDRSGARRL